MFLQKIFSLLLTALGVPIFKQICISWKKTCFLLFLFYICLTSSSQFEMVYGRNMCSCFFKILTNSQDLFHLSTKIKLGVQRVIQFDAPFYNKKMLIFRKRVIQCISFLCLFSKKYYKRVQYKTLQFKSCWNLLFTTLLYKNTELDDLY